MNGTLPPGPQAPALLQTLDFYSRRHRVFPRLRGRYGDTFSMRVFPGPDTHVMFSRPEDIRDIFAGDIYEFSGAAGNEVLRAAMGDRSVMLNDGDRHRGIRKYLMPAFSPKAVRGHRPMVEQIVSDEITGWKAGETISSLEVMSRITLEVMLQVVFGLREGARIEQLRPRLLRLVDVNPILALGWMYPRVLTRIPPWRGPQKNLEAVNELIYAEIAERIATGDRGDDVLSQLLEVGGEAGGGLSAAEIRDQLVTLVLAGYETTASTLSWTLHEIARSPELRLTAAEAAESGDENYLEACLREGMRQHPIIDFVVRRLNSEQRIGAWTLPEGTFVVPCIMLAHQDGGNFSQPESFRPERFLPGQAGGNAPGNQAWIPFGGGVRRCVGAAFAQMEGVIILREVLARFDILAERPAPNRLRNITNVPGDGAPVTLLNRP